MKKIIMLSLAMLSIGHSYIGECEVDKGSLAREREDWKKGYKSEWALPQTNDSCHNDSSYHRYLGSMDDFECELNKDSKDDEGNDDDIIMEDNGTEA